MHKTTEGSLLKHKEKRKRRRDPDNLTRLLSDDVARSRYLSAYQTVAQATENDSQISLPQRREGKIACVPGGAGKCIKEGESKSKLLYFVKLLDFPDIREIPHRNAIKLKHAAA
ncbi:hypothetical protein HHI36_011771 [Cryptolaemus montrouzieri]|uniref:Uncharacterized protein n=1 Tax=Cryptolaemus montrouzieri TaxID=559131 RepID=A0ABD2ND27_9CUCU